MEGEKLMLVRQTIDFLAANVLRATDELAIVAYDDKIEDALPLQRMDAQGVERAHKAISRITARGSTNLSGGLFRGLELMQASSEADVTAVLLFTDGLANQGVTDLQTIAAETHALANSAAKRPSVFTFGFGSDHDENMLRAIAEAAAGTYYFVKGKDDIPQAFGDCFGGLVSVVAQNIRLRFESLSPSIVLKGVEGQLASTLLPQGGFEVSVGDMYSEEERDILCTIELQASEVCASPSPAVRCTLSYINILQSALVETSVTSCLTRPSHTSSQPNEKVDQHRNRLKVAAAIDAATQRADNGDLRAGQEILKEAEQAVLESVSAASAISKGLLDDIRHVAGGMAERSHYREFGSKMSKAKMMSHMQQRCNYSNYSSGGAFDEATEMYSTQSKKSMKARLGSMK